MTDPSTILARAGQMLGLPYATVGKCNGFVWSSLGQSNRGTAAAIWADIVGAQRAFVRTWHPEPGTVLATPTHAAMVVDRAQRLIVDASERRGIVSVHDGSYLWNDPKTVAGIPR